MANSSDHSSEGSGSNRNSLEVTPVIELNEQACNPLFYLVCFFITYSNLRLDLDEIMNDNYKSVEWIIHKKYICNTKI